MALNIIVPVLTNINEFISKIQLSSKEVFYLHFMDGELMHWEVKQCDQGHMGICGRVQN